MPALLGEWRNGAGPLAQRLADAIEDAVERGELLHAWMLPSERNLAAALDISRSTTARAMELLAKRGVVRRVHGAGTFVAGRSGAAASTAASAAADTAAATTRALLPRGLRGKYRLGSDTDPGIAAATFPDVTGLPREALTLSADDLLTAQPNGAKPGSGYAIAGLDITRVAIAAALTANGLPTTPEALVATTGATQSLSLTFEMLLSPDDIVIVESPTYPTTLELLRRIGVRIVPVRTGDGTLGADALVRLARKTRATMAVVMATCNVATGRSLPDADRATLVHLAQTGVVVLDDRTLADYHPTPAPTPIAALAEHRNIITVGSFNKIYWGGLKMGWIRLHPSLVETAVRIKSRTDAGSSIPSQILLTKLLPHHADITAHRQSEMQRRTHLTSAFLHDELPDWRNEAAGIGPSQWIRLPLRDSADFVAFAHAHGTTVGYGGIYRSDGRPSPHLRTTLTSSDEQILAALHNLRDAWSAFPATRGRRR
ncbi:PLP-dependent aminotransferase family protein [Catenulispora rubra]|uniref:aminotransferase-like domain-containing protein n=1 Tax=Catenulispora rubra TaxID=280293 RepID=UPI001892885D|nr:PLP-dependent aminotransferase family protein [Catenulispora rubra]